MDIVANKELFEAFTFRSGISVKNRIAMAPMTTWASNTDGTVSDDEIRHYRARVGNVGLVITGCSRVLANGQGFTDEYAAYDDKFIPSLKNLAEAAKSGGAPAVMQIYHAGNKAVTALIPAGDLVSASAVSSGAEQFTAGETLPRPLTGQEILDMIKAFGDTTARVIEAGFDGVELHGAHGFLLQNFYSPYFNQRTDEWGGSPENRLRFPLAVVREVQRIIREKATKPFSLGYRISPEESQPGGLKIEDSFLIIDQLIDLGIDYVHASLENANASKPKDFDSDKTTAELLLAHIDGRIPMIAAGQIKTPEQAIAALNKGLAMVAVGQGLTINPNWVALAAAGEQVDTVLHTSRLSALAVPEKLWAVIDAAKGWFSVSYENMNK